MDRLCPAIRKRSGDRECYLKANEVLEVQREDLSPSSANECVTLDMFIIMTNSKHCKDEATHHQVESQSSSIC